MSMDAHHLTCGIVTYDRAKAEKKLYEVVLDMISDSDEVIRIVNSQTDLFATFKSGRCVRWVSPA